MDPSTRRARGDWQTPLALADAVVARLSPPAAVVEPTCGQGRFLEAAGRHWPMASLSGMDRNPDYVHDATRITGASVRQADFFDVDWQRELSNLPTPLLVLGNPPWVNRDTLGGLDLENGKALPRQDHLTGLAAMTGAGNFDVSEFMTRHLLKCLPPGGALAFLLKRSVAHRLLPDLPRLGLGGALYTIDARAHFGVAVDAVLFHAYPDTGQPRWADHPSLNGGVRRWLGMVGTALVPDVDAARATAHLEGEGLQWRSGVKHDCASVFELTREEDHWRAADGTVLTLEDSHVYPLMKGGDLHHGRVATRGLILPQEHPGQETESIAERAPAVHAWLEQHRERLAQRRSRIYRSAPRFAVFGVGPYSFSPWKVAVSCLHKRLGFRVVGPHAGRPVLFDDTCAFIGCTDAAQARRRCEWLTSGPGAEYLNARVFWEAKRPITTRLLRRLAVPE